MIFHSGSFPCSFIPSWTPTSGTKLVKNSPSNMMRPKRHCRTRQGKIIIFDYLELLYKGVYIHTAQRCSLNPLNTFPTPKVKDPDEGQFLEILPFWILFPLFIVSYSLSSNHFCHVTYFRTWHKKTYIYGRFQKRVINALKLHHCMRHLKYNTHILIFS